IRKGNEAFAGADLLELAARVGGEHRHRLAGGFLDEADVAYPDALAETGAHGLDDGFLGGKVHGETAHLAAGPFERAEPLRHGPPVNEAIAVFRVDLLDSFDLAEIGADAEYHFLASRITPSISLMACSRPTNTARATSQWPMFISTICGSFATGPTFCTLRPWPACTARPSFSAWMAASRRRASSLIIASPEAFAYAPVCSSTTFAPVSAAASSCSGSGSTNSDTWQPWLCSWPTASRSRARLPVTSRPPSVVSSSRRSGTRQQCCGRTSAAMASISSVTAISRLSGMPMLSRISRTSLSWMCRRSSRRCTVI